MNLTGMEIAAILTAVSLVLGQVAQIILSLRNHSGIKDIKVSTDGLVADKVAAAKDAGFVAGNAQGRNAREDMRESVRLNRLEAATVAVAQERVRTGDTGPAPLAPEKPQ